jgi:hypothetical protein
MCSWPPKPQPASHRFISLSALILTASPPDYLDRLADQNLRLNHDGLAFAPDTAGPEGAADTRQAAVDTDRAGIAEARPLHIRQEPGCPQAVRPGHRTGHRPERDPRNEAAGAKQGYHATTTSLDNARDANVSSGLYAR